MISRPKRLLGISLLALSCALLLSSCEGSVSIGEEPVLKEAEAEKQSRVFLAKEYGAVPPIDCPRDLSGDKGSKMVCVMGPEKDGTYYNVRLTTDSVKGDKINFTINVLGPKSGS